jgi:secondary thiamine-phosphate synthase enzyme
MIKQKEILLPPFRKGFHLIDSYILDAVAPLPETALINIFLKHTSAALMLNENADPDVRIDLATLYERIAPEGDPAYVHTIEGIDDMPAHFKTAITGNSITIPVTGGRFNTGTWQGIYLCEFRNHGSSRKIVITVYE